MSWVEGCRALPPRRACRRRTENHPTETISAADVDGSFGAKPEGIDFKHELPLSAENGRSHDRVQTLRRPLDAVKYWCQWISDAL